MSQGENGSDEEALHQRLITSTIVQKIRVGAKKTESFSSACIYRVPEQLRMLKEIAYTPHLIAIGPLHREDNHLKTPFQHVKMSYTNHLLSRLTVGIVDLESAEKMELTVVQECLAELKTLIDDAKKCYAEEVTLNEEMMLVDGCFILEFLYGYRAFMVSNDNLADFDVEDADTDDDNDVDDTKDADEAAHGEQAIDPIFGNNLNCAKVINDLVLMENQIPLFVLEKLFPLTVGRIPDCPDKDWLLTDYLQWFYDIVMEPLRNSNNSGSSKSSWCSPGDCVLRVFDCTTTAAEEEEEVESGNINDHRTTAKYYHILHYLHDRYLPNFQTEPEDYDFREMPSASELAYAGVKFVPDTGKDLFKFKFREPGLFQCCHRARFIIPRVTLEDSTEALLRNLIALEQCCPDVKEHVSSYAVVMDMLVNTDKDIQVLVKAGVLRNWLGATRDATDLFNNLCKEIILGEYFFDTCFKASKYSKRFWPKNMAHVRRTYFKSPWTFIAFCVGFIVFIVTVLQFVHDFFNISG